MHRSTNIMMAILQAKNLTITEKSYEKFNGNQHYSTTKKITQLHTQLYSYIVCGNGCFIY